MPKRDPWAEFIWREVHDATGVGRPECGLPFVEDVRRARLVDHRVRVFLAGEPEVRDAARRILGID